MSATDQKYRGKLEIIHSILENTQHEKSITTIMYESKLSNSQVKSYLAALLAKELLSSAKVDGKTKFVTTSKGQEYLSASRQLMSLLA